MCKRAREFSERFCVRYHFAQSQEEERSEELELMNNMPEFTVQDKVNLDAVVRDYEDGSLRCPPAAKGVVYFRGQRKTPHPVDMLDEWLVDGATGRIWIEQVRRFNRVKS